MHNPLASSATVAIACGGTGGHLFPGIAVAEQLAHRGCAVSLLISSKEVDQHCLRQLSDGAHHQPSTHQPSTSPTVFTLPAIGLVRGRELAFLSAFGRSFIAARKIFRAQRTQAVLGMGGFTSAGPLLAGKILRAKTFLHESNAIPGRANRWLSRAVDCAYMAFPSAATCLKHRRVTVSGTPVRRQFRPQNATSCCKALGLDSSRPVVLVTGGSQGASGVNQLVTNALPLLSRRASNWQWLHLSGEREADSVRQSYATAGLNAVVHPFLTEMDVALGAATAAITRAGGSSLAELADVGVPSILVPYPAATDNHQYLNAKAFEETGAARLLNQSEATPDILSNFLFELIENGPTRQKMLQALELWHKPRAAEQIAESILQ